MSNMDKYINNMLVEFKKNSFNVNAATVYEKLLFLYAYYHYFNADSSKISDIIHGNVYQADTRDRIAGIYIDEESDAGDVDAIISFYIGDGTFDQVACFRFFKEAENLICATQESKIKPRASLNAILTDEDYKISSTRPLKIKLITNYTPPASTKKSILKALSLFTPEHDYVSYQISFGSDIEYEIIEIEDPKEYVDHGTLKLDKENNYLHFGEEKSLIANISAKSLKELYEQYAYRGLFAQNLRYYVKNSTIDNNIVISIQEQSDNFWYYNNGIIIICDDYAISGKNIKIDNFSIINGGQTTKLVGETDFDNDFFIQCKIVKNKYATEDKRIEFIANVAERSNTQKPIKPKDLVANKPEQRMLKKQLVQAGIYCQIKRGEKVNKKLYPEAWQNTTNEELGQFLLSFVYQQPGIARNNKSTICSNQERYGLIFKKAYNSDLIGDLLKIKAYYKLWNAKIKKEDIGEDPYKVGLVNNGMLFTTAIIGVICKLYYRQELIGELQDCDLTELELEKVSQHDIAHHIFRKDTISKEQFFKLFEFCYKKFYRRGFEILKTFKPNFSGYSNFTKTNTNYGAYVLKHIKMYFQDGIPAEAAQLLSDVLYTQTPEDKIRNEQIIEQYVNIVSSAVSNELPVDLQSQIYEALIEYRTRTFRRRHIKAYEVFKNTVGKIISKVGPTTIDDLKALRCLDEYQLNNFGEDIINIVKRYLN